MKKIEFVYPATLSINMGSRVCELNCKHCGGHYLEVMTPTFLLKNSSMSTYNSILLSGGCDSSGKMLFNSEVFDHIENKKINLHIGHYDFEQFLPFMEKIHYISLDFTLDSEIIQNIYHLKQTSEDFKLRFSTLHALYLNKVVPHICVGLNFGKCVKEYEAIEYLSNYKLEKLVLIIFIPTRNTYMESCEKPNIDEVVEVFKFAKQKLPECKIQLGCMRPTGRYRVDLETRLIKEGCVDTIVKPSRKAVEFTKELGILTTVKEACCVFE
ncbi:MAG: hypothetical protein NTX05_00200 [Fusobacteria bacterium]|nr:hypothetical protein [Fusobacteriota bacterium]